MIARETVAWGDLTDDVYVIRNFGTGDEVHHIAKALTVGGRTTVVFSLTGKAEQHDSLTPIELATAEEIAAHQQQMDRFAVARALARLGSQIVDRGLPVPVGGRGIVVSFDLADDADLEPWSRYLSKRPQRGTSRPHVQAEAEGVEVYVYGPGTSGEFGPDLADPPADDLADAALTNTIAETAKAARTVEHGDSVGAFPIVMSRCVVCGNEAEVTPEDGICKPCLAIADPPGPHGGSGLTFSGHAVQDTAALQQDGRYDDNRGTEA